VSEDHVGEFLLDVAEFAQLLAELYSGVDVVNLWLAGDNQKFHHLVCSVRLSHRLLDAVFHGAGACGRDPKTPIVEDVHRDFESFALH
jgi:hypothetical protein